MLLGISLLLSVLLCEVIDRLARPVRRLFGGGALALSWRTASTTAIWLLAFGLTGRAVFAAIATAVTAGILVAISNIKRRYLREPLVFSDFALLEHVIRHMRLFYLPPRWTGAVLVGVATVIAVIVVWIMVEPRAAGGAAQAAALLGVVAVTAAAWFSRSLRKAAILMVGEPDLDADLAHIGLLASLTTYAVLWRHEGAALAPATNAEPLSPPYEAIVVIQAEAFVDLRRLGHSELRLPAFDKLKARARASGLLEVPCQAAYTLRPESSAITGVGFHRQGFDRFHPYLRPRRFAAAALPRRLSQAGWDTLFVHPYDGSFFRRMTAMPALGFAEFADERAFAGARRVGPYISDEAVGDYLLAEIGKRRGNGRPLFAYAVTMEAHDPYEAGRLPDENDPVRQYVRHIENADRMLARLAEALDASHRRVLLIFFGDHVPFLPAFADPFVDTRTDYMVVELGKNAIQVIVNFEVTRPEHLFALVQLQGGNSAGSG